jgi:hypothetical protein
MSTLPALGVFETHDKFQSTGEKSPDQRYDRLLAMKRRLNSSRPIDYDLGAL